MIVGCKRPRGKWWKRCRSDMASLMSVDANTTETTLTAPPMQPLATCGKIVDDFSQKIASQVTCENLPSSYEELVQVHVNLKNIIEEHAGKTVPWIYYACNNNDFTSIVDCWDSSIAPEECEQEWMSNEFKADLKHHRWKVSSRNDAIFPQGGGRWDGALVFVDGRWDILHKSFVGEYVPTERPWYYQPEGWGEPYVFTSNAHSCSNMYGSTYTLQITNGVVGIDKIGVCTAVGEEMTVFDWRGWDNCTVDAPCADGFGDCKTDDDCEGDLVCWNRQQGTTKIPWYTGGDYDMSSFNAIQLNYEVLNIGNADFCVRLAVVEIDSLDVATISLISLAVVVAMIVFVYVVSYFGILTALRNAFLGDLMLTVVVLLWKCMDLSSTYYVFFVEIDPMTEIKQLYHMGFVIFMVIHTIFFLYGAYYIVILFIYLQELSSEMNTTNDHRQRLSNEINICQADMLSFIFVDIFGALLHLWVLKEYPDIISVPFLICVCIQCCECGVSLTSFDEFKADLKQHRWKVSTRNDVILPQGGGRWDGALVFVDGKWDILHKSFVGEYVPTERPWYYQPEGWGEPYVFTSNAHSCSNMYGSTYTLQIPNGVVGIDKIGVCSEEGEGMTVFDWRGWDNCTVDAPCADGFGDCKIDDDCEGDLVCWNRQQGTTKIPWYTGGDYDMSSFNAVQLNHEVLNIGNADFCVRKVVVEVDEVDVTMISLVVFGVVVTMLLIVYAMSYFGILTALRHAFLGDLMIAFVTLLWKVIDVTSTYYVFFVEVNPLAEATRLYRIGFVIFMGINTVCFFYVGYYAVIQIMHLQELSAGVKIADDHRERLKNEINLCQADMISFIFEDTLGVFLQFYALEAYPHIVTIPFLICVCFQCCEWGISATCFSRYNLLMNALEMSGMTEAERMMRTYDGLSTTFFSWM